MNEPDTELTKIREYLDREFKGIDRGCTPLKLQSRDDLPKDDGIPILFHYTSADATKSILTSGSLRATHAQFLSDRTEFGYGIKLAREALSVTAGGPKKVFLSHTMDLLNGWLEDPDSEPDSQPYVVCFSHSDPDRFSQWMIYGDGGEGFSIGFDYEKLRCHFRKIVAAGVLPVTYEPKVQQKILTSEIEEYWRVCESGVTRWPDSQVEIEAYCRSALVSLLCAECAAFKHPGFKEEQEFRLVARRMQGQPKPSFRAGRFGITPYLDLKSPDGQKLPVVKIMQGPTADRESAKKGIEMLLADREYQGVDVDVSDIPQR